MMALATFEETMTLSPFEDKMPLFVVAYMMDLSAFEDAMLF